MKKHYYAAVEGFILGSLRAAGDPVGELTDEQAKYPLMFGHITDQEPKAKRTVKPTKSEEAPKE